MAESDDFLTENKSKTRKTFPWVSATLVIDSASLLIVEILFMTQLRFRNFTRSNESRLLSTQNRFMLTSFAVAQLAIAINGKLHVYQNGKCVNSITARVRTTHSRNELDSQQTNDSRFNCDQRNFRLHKKKANRKQNDSLKFDFSQLQQMLFHLPNDAKKGERKKIKIELWMKMALVANE